MADETALNEDQVVVNDTTPIKESYLDPEGGYADPVQGRMAELAAMTK